MSSFCGAYVVSLLLDVVLFGYLCFEHCLRVCNNPYIWLCYGGFSANVPSPNPLSPFSFSLMQDDTCLNSSVYYDMLMSLHSRTNLY
jgi:hypothetical protein